MNDQLLSVHDVAVLTGWSPLTIYKKASRNEIPGKLKLGYSLRFRASEINDWLFGEKSVVDPAVNAQL